MRTGNGKILTRLVLCTAAVCGLGTQSVLATDDHESLIDALRAQAQASAERADKDVPFSNLLTLPFEKGTIEVKTSQQWLSNKTLATQVVREAIKAYSARGGKLTLIQENHRNHGLMLGLFQSENKLGSKLGKNELGQIDFIEFSKNYSAELMKNIEAIKAVWAGKKENFTVQYTNKPIRYIFTKVTRAKDSYVIEAELPSDWMDDSTRSKNIQKFGQEAWTRCQDEITYLDAR